MIQETNFLIRHSSISYFGNVRSTPYKQGGVHLDNCKGFDFCETNKETLFRCNVLCQTFNGLNCRSRSHIYWERRSFRIRMFCSASIGLFVLSANINHCLKLYLNNVSLVPTFKLANTRWFNHLSCSLFMLWARISKFDGCLWMKDFILTK